MAHASLSRTAPIITLTLQESATTALLPLPLYLLMQMSSKKLTIGALSHVTQCGARGFCSSACILCVYVYVYYCRERQTNREVIISAAARFVLGEFLGFYGCAARNRVLLPAPMSLFSDNCAIIAPYTPQQLNQYHLCENSFGYF
jgi:ethanolamine transporter EutH